MPTQDNYFFGGLNTDDTDRLLPEGDYREAYYARGNEAGESNKGALESMTGTLNVPNEDLDETQLVIGSAKWIERSSIVYFVCSLDPETTPHSIWYYNTLDQTHTLILQDNVLNFQSNFKIYTANVVDNVLYWTDGYFNEYLGLEFNPPRMLNIDSAIAGYGTVDFQLLDVIKSPANKGVGVSLVSNGNQSNLLYGQIYQFSVQYEYENGERSVWSPISKITLPTAWDFVQGRNFLNPQLENAAELTFDSGSELVKRIRVAVRNGNIGDFEVFREIDKAVDGIGDNAVVTVEYDGTLTGEVIPLSQGLRGFDRVPQVAGVQDKLTSNELCYSNIVEGYNGVDIGDTQSAYLTTEIPYQVYAVSIPRYRFLHSNDQIEIQVPSLVNYGIVAGDTFVFEFIPTDTEETPFTVTVIVTDEVAQTLNGITDPADRIEQFLIYVGFTLSTELDDLGYTNTPIGFVTDTYFIQMENNIFKEFGFRSASPFMRNRPEKSMKTGVLHQFGIQYYDRAMRSGGVLTSDNMQMFVEFPTDETQRDAFLDPNSPYFVRPYVTGKHVPPDWARYYQIVYLGDRISDFQQRTGTSLELVPSIGLVKISLDTQYENSYGARINHTIQIGDTVRIVRAKGEAVEDGVTGLAPYAFGYVETTVQRYEEGGGLDGSEAIYVTLFDYNTVIGATNSFVVEIYSPRKESLNSVWNEIGEIYDIVDPYTEERRHGGQIYTGSVVTSPSAGGNTFVVEGDVRPVAELGTQFLMTFTPTVGSPFTTFVSNVAYNYATNQSTVTTVTNSDGTVYATCSFSTGSVTQEDDFLVYLDFGDVYVRPRATNNREIGNGFWRYWVEDPHVSDYFSSSVIDIGKPAIIDRQGGRKRFIASGIHGGSFRDNTNQNNLCSFDFNPLNKFDLDESFGEIRMIIQNGYTLKVFQDRKETSIYIQRTMAVGADGGANVSYTDRTFGGINPYESLYGTIHPASVKILRGDVYYYDFYSSKFVRSRTNGQQDLSIGEFKINAFTTTITDRIREGEYEVTSSVDEQNSEYVCYFKSLGEDGYKIGVLFAADENRWKTYLRFFPSWAENLGNITVLWNNADAYVMNLGTNLNFFGEDEEFSVKYVYAGNPNLVKTPLAHGMRCYPRPTQLVITTPEFGSYSAMRSTMNPSLFKLYENGYWVEYKRDELDPRFATEALARINGRVLRGYILIHELKYSGATKIVLFSTVTNFTESPSVI